MVEVLLAHRSLAADAVVAGMNRALTAGIVDVQVVIIEARRAAQEQDTVAPVIPIGSHTGFDRPKPSLASYDQLVEYTPRPLLTWLRPPRSRPPRES